MLVFSLKIGLCKGKYQGVKGNKVESLEVSNRPGSSHPDTTKPARMASSRRQQRKQRRRRKRLRQLIIIPRFFVLLVLVASTLVAPLSGFVSAGKGPTVVSHALSLHSGESWASAPQSEGGLAPNDFLSPNTSAAMIERLRASHGTCKFADTGSGNRTGPEIDDNILYFPLAKGTYQQTSPFGYRIHPISGIRRLHAGVDYASNAGNVIHALTSGRILKAGPLGGCGNAVEIEHNIKGEHFYTKYCHMLNGSFLVKEGDLVKPGQPIGLVGSTGNSTGNHLHFEVHPEVLEQPVDPIPWLAAHPYLFLGEQNCN